MFSYIWPIVLVIFSNTVYQICCKSTPDGINPFASLSVTYLVGAAASLILYFLLGKEPDLLREYRQINWTPIVLGIVIVGLEVGYIYAFKAGWPVSTASIVQSSFLAIILIAVGALFYHEVISWSKIIGVIICLIGLFFINK